MTGTHAVPVAFDSYREEQPPTGTAGGVSKNGVLEARFAASEGETYLAEDFARTPCHITGTLDHDDDLSGIATTYIQTPAAGLVQGDRQRIQIDVDSDARAHVSTQSATKVFGMEHNYGRLQIDLSVADNGYLEYLPEPTILYRNARCAATIALNVGTEATALVGDVVVPGRLARDEAFEYDRYYSKVDAHTPEGLAVSDAVHLSDDDHDPQRPGILGEYAVLGTLYVVSTALDATTVSDRVHERVSREDGIRAGASTLPNDSGILVRLLGHRAPDVNDGLYDAWDEIRQLIFGVDAPNQRKY